MRNIEDYKTTGEWFRDAHNEGYTIPLPMCVEINKIQKELNLNFSEVFLLLLKEKVIIKINNNFVYDMKGYRAISKKEF